MNSDTFEKRLTRVVGEYASDATRPIDATEIATKAMTSRPEATWPRQFPWLALRPAPRLVVIALLALALVAGVIAAGAWLLQRPVRLDRPLSGTVLIWSGGSSGGGTAQVISMPGGEITSLDLPDVYHCAHLLEDGRAVAYSQADGSLLTLPVDGLPSRDVTTLLWSGSFRAASSTSWREDGRLVAFPSRWEADSRTEALTILSLADGHVDRVGSVGADRAITADRVIAFVWAPDDRVAYVVQRPLEIEIRVADRDGTNDRMLAAVSYDSASAGNPDLAWSASGDLVGYAAPMGTEMHAVDVGGAGELSASDPRVAAAHFVRAYGTSNRLSPDGALLASVVGLNLVITPLSGRAPIEASIVDVPVDIAWSPDSTAVAVLVGEPGGPNAVVVYEARRNQSPRRIESPVPLAQGWTCLDWHGRS